MTRPIILDCDPGQDDAVAFVEASPDPSPKSLYEDVYVKSPYIHAKSAEKDPAWKAAERIASLLVR